MASVPGPTTPDAEQVLMPEDATQARAVARSRRSRRHGKGSRTPGYMELLTEQNYVHHVLRMPRTTWPDPVRLQRRLGTSTRRSSVHCRRPKPRWASAQTTKTGERDRLAEAPRVDVPHQGYRRPARHRLIRRTWQRMARQAAEGPLHCLSDRQPPAICVRTTTVDFAGSLVESGRLGKKHP